VIGDEPDNTRTAPESSEKAEPAYRFYMLYDKIYREDILRHAYELARANAGSAGVDGMTFAGIETLGVEGWLGACARTSSRRRTGPIRCGG
jgi:RNA-directed DNA polymerase